MQKDAIQQRPVARKQTVPFNMTPKWPAGYFEVLAEPKIPERQHQFYTHWVRQFFNANPGKARRSLGAVEIARFLYTLKNNPGINDWQITQARDALILYYEQFRGLNLGDLSVLDNPPPDEAKTIPTPKVPAALVPAPRKIKAVGEIPPPSYAHKDATRA